MWEHDGSTNLEVTTKKPVLPDFPLYHEINMIHESLTGFNAHSKTRTGIAAREGGVVGEVTWVSICVKKSFPIPPMQDGEGNDGILTWPPAPPAEDLMVPQRIVPGSPLFPTT